MASLTKILISFALLAFASCGKPSDPKVDVKNGASGGKSDSATTTDATCTTKSCPAIALDLISQDGKPLNSNLGTAVVGQPVSWVFKISSPGATTGRVRVAVVGASAWLTKENTTTDGLVKLSGTPNQATQSTASFQLVVRDLNRCEAIDKPKGANCTGDLSATNLSAGTQKTYDLTYQISASNNGGNYNGNTTPVDPYGNNNYNNFNNNNYVQPNNCNSQSSILRSIGGMIPFIGGLFNQGNGC